MEWQTRRKIIYGFGLFVMILSISLFFLKDIIYPEPTCFDKKQNGYELGIDCGGLCSLRCTSEVVPLTVVWTRFLVVSPGVYDLVGMVSNKNTNNASNGVSYVFNLFNTKGEFIGDVKGKTIAPINGDFPIVVQSFALPSDLHTATLSIVDDQPHYMVYENPVSPTLRITNERYEMTTKSRVYAIVKNMKRITLRNIPVIVTLLDENNNVYAVGTTRIDALDKEESKEISFTWNQELSQPPLRIKVYPIFDPFLAIQ